MSTPNKNVAGPSKGKKEVIPGPRTKKNVAKAGPSKIDEKVDPSWTPSKNKAGPRKGKKKVIAGPRTKKDLAKARRKTRKSDKAGPGTSPTEMYTLTTLNSRQETVTKELVLANEELDATTRKDKKKRINRRRIVPK